KIRTSGIVINVKSECRWCPLCHAPLFQYAECDRKRLEQCEGLCPTCCALNTVKYAKPHIDHRSTIIPKGGVWGA
ncbi:MAG: hypothetical protein Q7R65_00095, partial [bacterium]|nr:hypothetical protein [bacterium]